MVLTAGLSCRDHREFPKLRQPMPPDLLGFSLLGFSTPEEVEAVLAAARAGPDRCSPTASRPPAGTGTREKEDTGLPS
jgi:hypothetical protein